jgi:hydroxymethylpyrimidine/phosphomethylpyrimidine kinase
MSLSKALEKQLDSILTNYPIEYVKIGMIPDLESLEIIVNYLKKYRLKAVYDPVTVSSAGKRLAQDNLEVELKKKLFPCCLILTPNIYEAEKYSGMELTGKDVNNIEELKKAATIILKAMYSSPELYKKGKEEKAIVVKSFEKSNNKIVDLLVLNKVLGDRMELIHQLFEKEKISIKGNIHGTGCVFSSAIAAFLAKGNSIESSIKQAEEFFNEHFQKYIELPDEGKMIDLTIPEAKLLVINQIKEIYNYFSNFRKFSELIPEVRTNISGSLPTATNKNEIAGFEGRITVINGFPKASGEIKFGTSDHTARLILSAKEFDNSINFVMNLKYDPNKIQLIQENTDLELHEFTRESIPEEIEKKEHSTMQWLIKESVKKIGKIPDIIWDKGSVGKEPMMRIFGRNSKEMISKLKIILNLIEDK